MKYDCRFKPQELCAALGVAIVLLCVPRIAESQDDPDLPASLSGRMDKRKYMELRSEHIARLRGVPYYLPYNARELALQQMDQQERTSILTAGVWSSIGPAPIPNGQTSPSNSVSGRVTAIAVNPTDPNKVYVGTAQGGLYRTLDGGATWTALMDGAQSLAIGAVAIDPVTTTTVFVGTGEGNLSLDSFFGVGLYRITNAESVSPTITGPFESGNVGNGHAFVGTSITKIVIDPGNDNNMFVGNTLGAGGISGSGICCGTTSPPSGYLGLWLCANAQAATPTFGWVSSLPGGAVAGVTDFVIEPGNANTLVVSEEDFGAGATNSGIYRSTNALLGAGATYTRTLNFSGAQYDVKLATNKIGSTVTVLAGTEESFGTLRRSTDGGVTWPTTLAAVTGFCGGQCFYDIGVAIDPANASIMYVCGSANSGAAFIMHKSTDGGSTFFAVDASLHADEHAVTIAPSNSSIIYTGNDGGVWKTTNAGTNWTSLNTSTFNATQFQSIALHPIDPIFSIGGTQDNGTNWHKPDNTWTRADFGDGGFALIDQNAADNTNVTMYHTYFNQTNNLIGFARVTNTGSAVDGGWAFFGCGGTANGINCTDGVLFYAPMALGPGNPNTLYFGTDRLYRSANQGATMTAVSQAPFVSGQEVSAIGISRQNDNVRIVGLTNGKVYATSTGANPLTDVTGPIPAAYVARAVIDPNSSSTAYVTLSGFGLSAGQHVWKTTNLGGAWTASGTGIPDVPVNAFVIDPANSSDLYAGTDIGVYGSTDAGVSWSPFGTGLPRVAVFDMAIQNPSRTLRIATHGRGMWEINGSPLPIQIASFTGTVINAHDVLLEWTTEAR